MRKRGFTLVELSIVLVIIGLLIGGILAAQSMIGTAKIQSTVKQIQQFDISVENFHTKYNSLPGDSPYFIPNGNNNGKVQDYSYGTGDDDYFSDEIASFWKVLSEQEGWQTQYSNNATSGIVIGKNVPLISFGKKTGAFVGIDNDTQAHVYPNNFYTGNLNYYFLGTWQNAGEATRLSMYPSILPSEALAFDQKIDDGIANIGNIVAAGTTYHDLSDDISTMVTTGCLVNNGSYNKYNVSSTSYACDIAVKMSVFTGTAN